MGDPRPGRFCPSSYRYSPASLARAPEICADTLYVVGGLYGNLPALDVVERLAATESGVARVVFNGDFHWFDADPSTYAEIHRRVSMHIVLRGNVETELASEDAAVGCGCACPDSVSDADVARSNDILAERLAAWCEAAQVDCFASSHTCLPACRALVWRGRQTTVINNGAAGMPNFAGTRFGIATRISTRVAPPGLALYGMRVGALNVDAVRLDYDHDDWVYRFLAMWPAGSPAHRSYFQRIAAGPAYVRSQAEPAVIQLEAERLACAGRA